ncbi:MAG: hypothetical protein ACOX3K_05245 [Bacilli bacterium]
MKGKVKISCGLSVLWFACSVATLALSVAAKTNASFLLTPKNAGEWRHYAQRAATPEQRGIREYWIQCGGTGYFFTKPLGVEIEASTTYDLSGFEANDPRYINYVHQTVFYDLDADAFNFTEAPDYQTFDFNDNFEKTAGARKTFIHAPSDLAPAEQFELITVTRVINSAADFVAAREAHTISGTWTGYYVVGSDFSIPSDGPYSSTVSTFNGTFDGRGHTITGGMVHAASPDATKSFFGMVAETSVIKNIAFKGTIIGLVSGIIYELKGMVDNCLFDCVRLGDTVYKNQSIIYHAGATSTISNSMFYLRDATSGEAGNDNGVIAMLGGSTTNSYVFSSKITGYDYRALKTGVALHPSATDLQTIGALSGFDASWNLTSTRAKFFAKMVDLHLDPTDGNNYVELSRFGLSSITAVTCYENNVLVESSIATGNLVFNSLGLGEHYLRVVIDDKNIYRIAVTQITKVISSYADFTAARDANTEAGVWTGHYVVGADFNIPTDVAYSSSVSSFNGTFDGRGHTITGGMVHAGTPDATKSFFGAVAETGVIKNIAFKDTIIGIGCGIIYEVKGLVDNCLFDCLRLGDAVYNNQGIIFHVTNTGTISNSMFYFRDATAGEAGNDKGVFTMLGGSTTNTYVFSSKITGYDYRALKTGVALHPSATDLQTIGVLSGFKPHWNLFGIRATFKF